MTERAFFDVLVLAFLGLSVVTFAVLLLVAAPYGRHARTGFGPTVPNRLGWILMEAPASLLMFGLFAAGDHGEGVVAWMLLVLWQAHYVHRAFIYPLRLRTDRKRMPLLIPVLAILFNTANAYINGRWVFHLSGGYALSWLWDPRFVAGLALFVAGYVANRHSDHILRSLRKPGETGYAVPEGGLYRFVSCPNYLGEVVEWLGWAIMTWSLAGLAFAVWTAANLAPRARAHHLWYRERFAEYPRERRALVPFVW